MKTMRIHVVMMKMVDNFLGYLESDDTRLLFASLRRKHKDAKPHEMLRRMCSNIKVVCYQLVFCWID